MFLYQLGILVFVLNIFVVNGNPNYKYHQGAQTWNEARKICEAEGLILAIPADENEVNKLIDVFGSHQTYIHVGFHNFYADSNKYAYYALTGEPLQNYYNIWETGEPNYPDAEKCLLLSNLKKIHDGNCNQKLSFICQKKNIRNKTVDIRCPIDDIEYRYAEGTGKCFKIHMNPMGFSSAARVCRGEGGNLAIIRNNIEENFLRNMFNEPKYTASYTSWNYIVAIGVHDLFENGHYMTILNEPATYMNWAAGHPNAPKTEHCVSMNKGGQLDDYPCDVPVYFACELIIKE